MIMTKDQIDEYITDLNDDEFIAVELKSGNMHSGILRGRDDYCIYLNDKFIPICLIEYIAKV